MNDEHPINRLDCDATVRRLWDFLDEELDAERMAEVEAHLRTCAACTEHVKFAEFFLAALHQSWPAPDEQPGLRQRVLARLTAEGFRAA